MKNYSPIIQAIITEKSSMHQSNGQYTFMVRKEANKIDIKRAVKEIYGVDVKTVRVGILPKKTRVLKGKYEWVKRPSYKKALVTLKNNKTIDPNKIGGAKAEKTEKVTKEKKDQKAKKEDK